MKKLIALVMVLCLVFTFFSEAFAAGKPKITQQPETATTNKKGNVSFTIKVTGNVSYTWYLTNPSTGEKITAKKLKKSKSIKGLGINGENSSKLRLSNVPESMHGWQIYCHINGNGYKLDSDTVLLLVYGLEAPEITPAPVVEEPTPNPESAEPAQSQAEDIPAEPLPVATETPDSEPAHDEDNPEINEPLSVATETPEPEPEYDEDNPEIKTVTVKTSSNLLRKLDSAGNIVDMEPVSSLEFVNVGSCIVTSQEPILSWSVGGVRFQPPEPVREFRVLNITEDLTISIMIVQSSAITAQLDTEHMCKVTCKGCTFTYLGAGIRSATQGEVPAGAPIRIVSSGNAENGYRINGGEPENQGKTSFVLTVTENVEIVVP